MLTIVGGLHVLYLYIMRTCPDPGSSSQHRLFSCACARVRHLTTRVCALLRELAHHESAIPRPRVAVHGCHLGHGNPTPASANRQGGGSAVIVAACCREDTGGVRVRHAGQLSWRRRGLKRIKWRARRKLKDGRVNDLRADVDDDRGVGNQGGLKTLHRRATAKRCSNQQGSRA